MPNSIVPTLISAQPERIFELLGTQGNVSQQKLQAAEAYAKGMALYQQRDWAAAGQRFSKGLDADPTDGPCAALKARCEHFGNTEPSSDWTGVFDITTK